jgi:DnaJ-class molecular chaperone
MEREKACEILGISLDQKENAKKAYLRLSREKHPDRGGSPEEFLLIYKAYKTLVEVERPEEFRSERIEFNVKVGLEESVFGITVETHIRPQTVSSSLIASEAKSKAHTELITVTEKIPPMVLLNKPLVVHYRGIKIGSEERDIVISYSIREHERYRICRDRSKALLSVEEKIPVMVAVQGGIVEVDTMFGPRKLNIAAGTNIGDSYVLDDHGPLGPLEVIIAGMEMPDKKDDLKDKDFESRKKIIQEENEELKKNQEEAARVEREISGSSSTNHQ